MRLALLPVVLVACAAACGGGNRAAFIDAPDDGGALADAGDDEREGGSPRPKPARDGGGGGGDDDGGEPVTLDPEEPGPFDVDEASGSRGGIAMRAFYPKTDGKQPVVVFGHGFQIPPSQYDKPLRHLASHGFVAMTADFKASLSGGDDNDTQAEALVSGLDWARGDADVGPHADVDRAGMSGHSLGGKLALLAATKDSRVKASIVLDPVDGNGVVVADLLGDLRIPTTFLGETLDGSAGVGGQACAPTSANYATFFEKANAPSAQVTVAGASHMSFLDDISSCGFPCTFCKKATTPAADVARITRGFLVAFYERYLRNRTGYAAYLETNTDLVEIETK